MHKKIGVGIIGAGGIAQYAHIPSFQKVKDVEVLAVCDVVGARAMEVAKKMNIPHYFDDTAALLEMAEIDAVSICTWNESHGPLSLAALQAGKHVLCEKPPALNAQEVAEVVEATKKADKKLMYAFNYRFAASAQVLKQFIEDGELGEIYYAKAGYLRRRGSPGGWFTQKSHSGGGPLIDLGVHILETTWWLMGTPEPATVSGSTYCKIGTRGIDMAGYKSADAKAGEVFDVEDLATGFIRFKNGTTMFLETSWVLNCKTDIIYHELYGTLGGAKFPPLEIYKEQSGSLVDVAPIVQEVSTYDAEVQHFIQCLREDKEPIPSGEQGLWVMKMLDGIYESGELGREVAIG